MLKKYLFIVDDIFKHLYNFKMINSIINRERSLWFSNLLS